MDIGFGASPLHLFSKMLMIRSESQYLLTFCPPGPDDFVNLVMAIFSGMVFSSRLENQRRAASYFSEVFGSSCELLPEAYALHCEESTMDV